MNKGFTLIEVLFSLVILSIITIITTNILQSSLETERISTKRLEDARSLNSSSIVIKRDLRQIMNIHLRDFYGKFIEGTIFEDELAGAGETFNKTKEGFESWIKKQTNRDKIKNAK